MYHLSIVATLYKSSPYIAEFVSRVSKCAEKISPDYEIILVDDGSPDDSLAQAQKVQAQNNKVKIIELSTNYGHHPAMMCGLTAAKGDYVFLIDVDLEEPPELLDTFWAQMQADKNLDAVYGVQHSRKGKLFEQVSGHIFYWFFNLISDVHIDPNVITARLMDRNYVDALMHYSEKHLFLPAIWAHAGFHQKAVKVEKLSRGITSYSLRRRIALFTNSIASFSSVPLVMFFYIGLSSAMVSILYVAYLIITYFLYDRGVQGWTSTMVSVWFLGGLILSGVGIWACILGRFLMRSSDGLG